MLHGRQSVDTTYQEIRSLQQLTTDISNKTEVLKSDLNTKSSQHQFNNEQTINQINTLNKFSTNPTVNINQIRKKLEQRTQYALAIMYL